MVVVVMQWVMAQTNAVSASINESVQAVWNPPRSWGRSLRQGAVTYAVWGIQAAVMPGLHVTYGTGISRLQTPNRQSEWVVQGRSMNAIAGMELVDPYGLGTVLTTDRGRKREREREREEEREA